MNFSIFTKILLLLVAIFLGLAYYAYGVFQKEKEQIAQKKVIVKVTQAMHHPSLSTREKNETTKEHNETNQTTPHIEGTEYISREELDRRLLEQNFSEEAILDERFEGDEEIIPLHEIENYPLAQTIPLDEGAEISPVVEEPIENPRQEDYSNLAIAIEDEENNPF